VTSIAPPLQTHPLDESGSFSWLAHPDERMQRASTAIALDSSWLLVDPVDHPGLDDVLVRRGEVYGVCVLLDRHRRDADAIASRLGVPVYTPGVLAGHGRPLRLPGVEERRIPAVPGWNEAALWLPDRRLLVCADVLGTAEYFLSAAGDPIGVHPLLRLRPPRRALGDLGVESVAVGHGPPLVGAAGPAVERALATARRALPRTLGRQVAAAVVRRRRRGA
jgi:hypothetical protein